MWRWVSKGDDGAASHCCPPTNTPTLSAPLMEERDGAGLNVLFFKQDRFERLRKRDEGGEDVRDKKKR